MRKEIEKKIIEITTLIDGLKRDSFEVSNKPFGTRKANINYLISLIDIDKKNLIDILEKELLKIKNLLNERE